MARCSLRLGNDFDDGRAIRMAQAAGAAVTRMDAAEVAVPITPPRKLVTGILVNGQGQRFINEDTYYGRVGQEILFRQDGEAYLIVDESLYEVTRAGLGASWVAETPEELETEMGLPDGSLRGHAGALQPPRRRRSRPAVPQGGAVRPAPGRVRWGPTTCGSPTRPASTPRSPSAGLVTSVDGEVGHVDGGPIPGLFAAGRTTSGVAAFGYASGISLGDGTFFGRRAGRAAAPAVDRCAQPLTLSMTESANQAMASIFCCSVSVSCSIW